MRSTAAAAAHPNIAFIKYWGNQDHELRIPANSSLSMNLKELETRTTVSFDSGLKGDSLVLNGKPQSGPALKRVSTLLERIRELSDEEAFARVVSSNNFPAGAGIASSASAFAALAYAACSAADLCLSDEEVSRLARTGSGSACRSIPGGYVEWQAGSDHESSFAFSIAGPEHWDLVDLVVLLSTEHKKVGSTQGHRLAETSPLQRVRVADADRRLKICRKALLERDFSLFAEVVEQDSNLMHAVMMTSDPPLYYWQPGTLQVMREVRTWREEGLPVCFTVDAGPNVHVLCQRAERERVKLQLSDLKGVRSILECTPGGPARLLEPDLASV
jgi:diphosphomevalonate decarboxylase